VGDTAIKVEGVSKKFCRRLRQAMYYGSVDVGRGMMGLQADTGSLRPGEFWAVRDVSFELKKGETMGLIGPNGSGKSTLLRLLNGIYQPDAGRIEITGRVGALIAVGAGFHPLMTGRENIYLNCTILGMTRGEIDKRFDDIVGFADIGEFLDSPVKTYSSGMYVRLAFSCAIHVDPDILLIDEVLAVGDLAFSVKCVEKIKEFKGQGKTIILVTHDPGPVKRVCGRALLLEKGKVSLDGPSGAVVDSYMRSQTKPDGPGESQARRWGTGDIKITSATFLDEDGRPANGAVQGSPVTAVLEFEAKKKVDGPVFGMVFRDHKGEVMSIVNTRQSGPPLSVEGDGSIRLSVDAFNLTPGMYAVTVAVYDSDRLYPFDELRDICSFEVKDAGLDNHGLVYLPSRWELS